MPKIHIIGAGLAGAEAAWQAAKRGAKVVLYEQKPKHFSPAHKNANFAELVCSNSLRANGLANAIGLLKEEMRLMDSLIMSVADSTAVPAGGALAVDRDAFAAEITRRLQENPNIEIKSGVQVESLDDISETESSFKAFPITIIATGPLTDGKLTEEIMALTGENHLYFHDAAAPIVTKESVDMTNAYFGSRYGKGDASYINCPMTRSEYELFYNELINAEEAEQHEFEKDCKIFEGCMPVERMAKRGEQTLLFGPLKPVGLPNPHDNDKIPHAVVQLRQDNSAATLYNLVGFQTHLKWGEQQRVFGLIPALKNAEFVRFGVMHRNTYICSPKLLTATYAMRQHPNLYFAGQITGVEGYIESASSGLVAGINAAHQLNGEKPLVFHEQTAHGALAAYVSNPANSENFQPMKINFGILPPLGERIRNKQEKNTKISERGLEVLKQQISHFA